MKILIVTAVPEEELRIRDALKYTDSNFKLDFLCTGPSVPFTMYHLTKHLCTASYDMHINAGICGSFREDMPPGTVLNITKDTFADIGISYPDKTVSLFNAGFWNDNEPPFIDGCLINQSELEIALPHASAITVNTTSGNAQQIEERVNAFRPDTESMEGAAFAYVCEKEKLRYLQIRAVSNRIVERHKQKWNIPSALSRLGKAVANIVSEINKNKTLQ